MATKKKKASAQLMLGETVEPAPEKPNNDNVVYIVDGQGYIFRAYYAMRRLSTSKGQATNAVFGFTTMLLKILKDIEPKHLAICFDPGGKVFRHEIYAEYKGTRSPPPADLPAQIPLIHRLVDAMRIKKLVIPNYEADDVIATLRKKARAAGKDVVIVTGDKDLCQLVDDHTMLLDEMRLGRGSESNEIRRAQVVEKFGVEPQNVIDVLALAGDSSDNVPGVDGIGEKTAAELVKQFGDLEQVLAHADDVKQPSRRDKLKAQAEQARLSKRLVAIRDDVLLPDFNDVGDLKYEGPDKPKLKAFFNEMEFRRLENDPIVRDIVVPAELLPQSPTALPTETTTVDRTLYRAVTDAKALREVATRLGAAGRFAVRTEVDKPGAPDAKLVGIAVAWDENQAVWIPAAAHPEGALQQSLAPLLADRGKTIVAHDGKFDVNTLFFAGWPTFAIKGDPMLCAYLLDPDEDNTRLINVARRTLGHPMIEPDSVFGKGKTAVGADKVPLEVMTPYAAEAADCTLRCANVLEPRLMASEMTPLYREL